MKFYHFALLFLILFACQTPSTSIENTEINPAAEGFQLENSDVKAIEIADQVMQAMGGRANWDATRYLNWNFFGRRTLFWDKQTGAVQIEYDSIKIKLNIYEEDSGVAYEKDEKVVADSTLQAYLKRGKS
ncbi:MAG: hypothetical protein AAGI49_10835, partial [Bacteroidota bacterium]